MCFCVLHRNSRWPPKMAGKPILGKVASTLCRYPVCQKFRQNYSISHRFRDKCILCILHRNTRWPPRWQENGCNTLKSSLNKHDYFQLSHLSKGTTCPSEYFCNSMNIYNIQLSSFLKFLWLNMIFELTLEKLF